MATGLPRGIMSSSDPGLTWKHLVVLDLATEDDFGLAEVAEDPIIREILETMVAEGLIEATRLGRPVDTSTGLRLLNDDDSWTIGEVGFVATSAGHEAYHGLGEEGIARLWREAWAAGYGVPPKP